MALLVPELAANVTSLLRSEASLDSTPRPSDGGVHFELNFPPLMAVGIVILGVAVLVGAWAPGSVLVPNSGAFLIAFFVGAIGDNSGSSLWKTTWHRTGASLVATILFSPTLVVGIGEVRALGIPLN